MVDVCGCVVWFFDKFEFVLLKSTNATTWNDDFHHQSKQSSANAGTLSFVVDAAPNCRIDNPCN